jgi:hypothetical protein
VNSSKCDDCEQRPFTRPFMTKRYGKMNVKRLERVLRTK